MKNEQFTKNSISESLLNKNVYYAMLSSRENLNALRGDIALMRKSFYENGRKSVKINKETERNGVKGQLDAKLSRHNFNYKRVEGAIATEECYKNSGVYTLAVRDLNGYIRSKIFYNKNLLWIKTEYYGINDFVNAELIFKPVNTENAVERFEYDPVRKNYVSTMLYPTPYSYASEEESIINSKASAEMFIISMEGGDFAYLTRGEIENREKLLSEINEKGSVLNSVWVTEAEAPVTEEETKAEETAEEMKAEPENKAEVTVNEPEAAPESNSEIIDKPEETALEAEVKPEIIQAKIEIDETSGSDNSEKLVYTGTLIEGKRNGRGRTDRKSGLTAYDGEYLDNKRNGFGCSYYKNGNLSYAGFWKDDKKDGMGVSFRNSDHAVQITNWKEGKPESHTTIFDNDGHLKYTGKIVDGVKKGLSVAYDKEKGGFFAGKWLQNGESGCGALFDSEGNLIYAGFLKDGKREGQGTEFDKNGEVIFTGTFKNDEYASGTLYKKI